MNLFKNQAGIKKLFGGVNLGSSAFIRLMDEFPEGILITNNKGVVQYFNRAQAKIDDLTTGYVMGRKVTELYEVDDNTWPVMKCLETQKSIINFSCFYRTHLGKLVNSIHNVFPIFLNQQIVGTICFVVDYKILEQTFNAINKLQEITQAQEAKIPRQKKDAGSMDNNGTRFTFEDIIGKSPQFKTVVESVRLASDSPSSVMLFGETGTGKELFAQSIHNNSRRRLKQYVAINCSAIPEHLLEGILFGTSKGAFTGAIEKLGLFEQANGGSLFLDEINSMPIRLQTKLLRVLQEHKVRRVGSLKEIEVDVKLISSTNEDPHQAVRNGTLRQDLLYRLHVVFVCIPPLRERLEDMELLIYHFLNKFNRSMGKSIRSISNNVADLFHKYHWPGNVRELEHVIEGAMNLVNESDVIRLKHLPAHLQSADTMPDVLGLSTYPMSSDSINPGKQLHELYPGVPVPVSSKNRGKSLNEIHAEIEVTSIRQTLSTFQGNIAKSARYLGLSPQLLRYRMKKFNIDRQEFVL